MKKNNSLIWIGYVISRSANMPWTIFTIVLLLIIWGILSSRNVPLSVIPDLSDPQVILSVKWPGYSPDLVENYITFPIVQALVGLSELKTVRGLSMNGTSIIYALLREGEDFYQTQDRIKTYIDSVSIPKSARVIPGPDATGVGWIFEYVIFDKESKYPPYLPRSIQDWNFKQSLLSLKDVSEVASIGGFKRQYDIRIDPSRLDNYGIDLSSVIKAIRENNDDIGVGIIELSGREVYVRGLGRLGANNDEDGPSSISNVIEDLKKIPILRKIESGFLPSLVLGDLADISIGFSSRRGLSDFNGHGETAGGIVLIRQGADVVDVSKRVRNHLRELEKTLPNGLEVVVVYDQSLIIHDAIEGLFFRISVEIFIVILVCFVFLLHIRSTLIIAISLIPALIVSIIPFGIIPIQANVMSLGGIAMAVGTMVDASIVMVENIRHGSHSRKFLIKNIIDVTKSIFISMLIISISFLPVLFLGDQSGRLFSPLAITKTIALLVAALFGITFIPALISYLLSNSYIPIKKNKVVKLFYYLFSPILKYVIDKFIIVVIFYIFIVVMGVFSFYYLNRSFMPKIEEGSFMYMPVTSPGVSAETMRQIITWQNKKMKTIPEVDRVFAKAGRADTATDPAPLSMIETIVLLKPRDLWRDNLDYDDIRHEITEAVKISGVAEFWTQPIIGRIDMITTGIRTPIGIRVLGKDINTVEKIGKDIEDALRDLPDTRSILADRFSDSSIYLDIIPDRDALSFYSLSIDDIYKSLSVYVGGLTVSSSFEDREIYPIVLRSHHDYRSNIQQIRDIPIKLSDNRSVKLYKVAEIDYKRGPDHISSEDAKIISRVLIQVNDDVNINDYINEAKEVIDNTVTIPSSYIVEFAGQYESMKKSNERLLLIIPIVLMIIIFFLYIFLKDLKNIFIILSVLPFTFSGVSLALYFSDEDLSLSSWIGFLAVTGIAIETGMIMIVELSESYRNFIQRKIKFKKQLKTLLWFSAMGRVRPKLMTVFTLVVGLLPMLAGGGPESGILQSIAIPMIGGISCSMIFTLFIIPSLYFYLHKNKHQ